MRYLNHIIIIVVYGILSVFEMCIDNSSVFTISTLTVLIETFVSSPQIFNDNQWGESLEGTTGQEGSPDIS